MQAALRPEHIKGMVSKLPLFAHDSFCKHSYIYSPLRRRLLSVFTMETEAIKIIPWAWPNRLNKYLRISLTIKTEETEKRKGVENVG